MTREEKELFENDPRDLVLQWEEEGMTGLLLMFVKWLSHDDVRDVLDSNELSPRFFEDEDRECEDCGSPLENASEVDLCQDCQEEEEDENWDSETGRPAHMRDEDWN